MFELSLLQENMQAAMSVSCETSIRSEVDRKYECCFKKKKNNCESCRECANNFFLNFIDISTNIRSFSCACGARDVMIKKTYHRASRNGWKIHHVVLSSNLGEYHIIWLIIHFDSLSFSVWFGTLTTDIMWLPRYKPLLLRCVRESS